LDEDGYLRIPPEELAQELGVSTASVQAGLSLLQQLEPAGVGAGSLAECLKLQLIRRHASSASLLSDGQRDRDGHVVSLLRHGAELLAQCILCDQRDVKRRRLSSGLDDLRDRCALDRTPAGGILSCGAVRTAVAVSLVSDRLDRGDHDQRDLLSSRKVEKQAPSGRMMNIRQEKRCGKNLILDKKTAESERNYIDID
ncbi:MAG: hypothetical protein IKI54_02295, partial [Lachnospiraceae bacterium]|nr:hypothetical protein [Lachnospiraceae bacterium]